VDVSPLLGTINNWGVKKSERGMGLVNGEPVGRILRVSQSHDSNHFCLVGLNIDPPTIQRCKT
jgi:hypothetical protein